MAAHLALVSHTRSESEASHNYSVLDYYDMETTAGSEPSLSGVAHSYGDTDGSSTFVDACEQQQPRPGPGQPISAQHTGQTAASATSTPTPPAQTPEAAAKPWRGLELVPVTERTVARLLAADTDMYGFRKTLLFGESTRESYNRWFAAYLPHYAAQKKKWELLLKSNGLAAQTALRCPARFPPKSDKVKKLVRKGIPPEWRGGAWFFYAGGNEKLNKNPGVYAKIVAQTAGTRNRDTEVIERDLHRTFPDNVHFSRSETPALETPGEADEPAAISTLRRVLVAFAHYQPLIGYCQSLNFIAGLLLLVMSEEHTFWMLVIMTDRIIPKVHSANLEGVHTDQGVLMMCIKEYIPKLWHIIGKSYDGSLLTEDKILTRLPPLSLVTSLWFMSVFIGLLPIESVMRIWDILWYEGLKTIFRISLTICRLCLDHPAFGRDLKHGESSTETEQIEIFQFIQNQPKSITDPNLLIDLCFKKIGGYGFGFLSQEEINKCREFVSHQRSKLQARTVLLGAEMSEHERAEIRKTQAGLDGEIHDVYGFNRSIMSGVAWNRHISGMMRKKIHRKMK